MNVGPPKCIHSRTSWISYKNRLCEVLSLRHFVCSRSRLPVTLYTHEGVDKPTCRQKAWLTSPLWVCFVACSLAYWFELLPLHFLHLCSQRRTITVTLVKAAQSAFKGNVSEHRCRRKMSVEKVKHVWQYHVLFILYIYIVLFLYVS